MADDGTLIIREHDRDIEGLEMVIDIEHMLYDLQVMSWADSISKFYAHYRSANEWVSMFEANGFRFRERIDVQSASNPTKFYYAVFVKESKNSTTTTKLDADDEIDYGF
jgi:tRNA/tmRNA/rRNA uracil-C5-methylase (TrmA/RlmC/RlmD family)